MAELKTRKTGASVAKFIAGVRDERLRTDAGVVMKLMKQVTRAEPKLWGPAIVGFGDLRLVYPSGRELDWFVCGFSPRKSGLVLYLMGGLAGQAALLAKLGKHKIGKSCLYLGPLDQVDLPTLKSLIVAAQAKAKRAARGA